jgi:photosystem II stability/assembly factor-like uncharacterized protein
MSTSAIILANRITLLAIISAVLSCDSLTGPDTVTPEKFTQSDYYILPGTSAIIDLESVVDQSFLNGTLSVFEKPKRGTLSYATTSMIKYKPGPEFQEGEDHFVLSVVNNGKILAKGTMTIKMKKSNGEFPCALIPVEDKIKLESGSSSVSTRILDNDWLCDIDKSNITISIQTLPKFGQALVDNESIIYTPAAEYEDRDELIYKVTEITGEIVSYGLLSFHAYGEVTITIQETPNRMGTSLFLVDENTGFLGTRLGVYKTTDGGDTWDLLGATWKSLPIPISLFFGQYSVTSVVFVSELTGFIVVHYEGRGYFGEQESYTEVMKTEDAGITWKGVLSDVSDIQFINRTTGYAIGFENIFVTEDAGETWTELLAHSSGQFQSIDHFQVTEENKLFAVLSDERTSIITSQDGSEWRPVANFSSDIFSIGFSPSGEVGFAIVGDGAAPQNNNSNPNLQPISIFKTVDNGETWVEEIIDKELQGFPIAMAIPSNDVAYFLCNDSIIKYSNK